MAVFYYIAFSEKQTEDFQTFNYLFTLFQNIKKMKTKDKTIQILQKNRYKF